MEDRSTQRKRKTQGKTLVILTGLVAFVFLVNAILSLFGLHTANEQQLRNLQKLNNYMHAMETARNAQVEFKKQVQEWKNILIRGQNPQDLNRYVEAHERQIKMVSTQLEELKTLAAKTDLDVAAVQALYLEHEKLGGRYRSALQQYNGQDPQTIFLVDKLVRGIDREPTEQMDRIVMVIWEQEEKLTEQVQKDTQTQYDLRRKILVTGTAIGIFLVFILLWLSFSRTPE